MAHNFIKAQSIKRLLELLGYIIECKPSDNQHVQTIVYEIKEHLDGIIPIRGKIIYNEIQHTEAIKGLPWIPHFCKDHVADFRQCRAIRMAYHDLLNLGIITLAQIQGIPSNEIHHINIKPPKAI